MARLPPRCVRARRKVQRWSLTFAFPVPRRLGAGLPFARPFARHSPALLQPFPSSSLSLSFYLPLPFYSRALFSLRLVFLLYKYTLAFFSLFDRGKKKRARRRFFNRTRMRREYFVFLFIVRRRHFRPFSASAAFVGRRFVVFIQGAMLKRRRRGKSSFPVDACS